MVRVQVMVDESAFDDLQKMAKCFHTNLSTIVRQILMKELESVKKNTAQVSQF